MLPVLEQCTNLCVRPVHELYDFLDDKVADSL
jgi:hypothetical protein